jgi:hypothetical protein
MEDTKPNQRLEDFSSSVAPNIFDVLCNADHIATLCLANLLSPSLWKLGKELQKTAPKVNPLNKLNSDIPASIQFVKQYINKKFTHVNPIDTAKTYGMIDLESEKARFSPAQFDGIIKGLVDFFTQYQQQIGEPGKVGGAVLDWVSDGVYPNYVYLNYDLVSAHHGITGLSVKSPNPLTSCLDEVALFISLVLTLIKKEELSAIIIMSSITHYSAFGYSLNGQRWWFNGKNRLYSKRDWDQMVEKSYSGIPQSCFDDQFENFNKITTVSGSFEFDSGNSGISDNYLEEYLKELHEFFGIELTQITSAIKNKKMQAVEADDANFLRALLNLESEADLLLRLQNLDTVWSKKVFYNYRSLNVGDYQPYLQSARRNPLALKASKDIKNLSQVIRFIKSLPGNQSIFGDRERIAMPDETLRFKTGTDRDKCLLTQVMLEFIQENEGTVKLIQSIYTEEESLIKIDFELFSVPSFEVRKMPNHSLIKFTL